MQGTPTQIKYLDQKYKAFLLGLSCERFFSEGKQSEEWVRKPDVGVGTKPKVSRGGDVNQQGLF